MKVDDGGRRTTARKSREEPGLLFAAEGSGIDAVEVLALKIAAFLQMVESLRRHYLLLGRPAALRDAGGEPLGPARSRDRSAAAHPLYPRAPFASAALRTARLAADGRVADRAGDRGEGGEGAPERPNAVPDDLWTGVLLFALRLVARGPGFGLTPEPGGSFAYDTTHPTAALDAVRAEAADLLHPLHAVLFERQAVHAEIQAVLAELLAEED